MAQSPTSGPKTPIFLSPNKIPITGYIKKWFFAKTNDGKYFWFVTIGKHPKLIFIPVNARKCLQCNSILIDGELTCCNKETFRVFNIKTEIPLITSSNTPYWEVPIWEEYQKSTFDIKQVYDDLITLSKQLLVFPDELSYKLAALWAISTYKKKYWNTVPYLNFKGKPESGKTNSLIFYTGFSNKILKPGVATGISMIRIANNFDAGVTIDESHTVLKDNEHLVSTAKMGHTRGAIYTRASDDENGVVGYNVFGYRAFGGIKTLPYEIDSRTITLDMYKATPKIPWDSITKEMKDKFKEIRSKLLYWMITFDDQKPPILPLKDHLIGRSRDVYGSLIRTAMLIGVDYQDIIDYALELESEIKENNEESMEYRTVAALWQLCASGIPKEFYYSDLKTIIFGENDEEDKEIKSRRSISEGTELGYSIKKLGFEPIYTHGIKRIKMTKSNKKKLKLHFKSRNLPIITSSYLSGGEIHESK